MDTLLFLSLGIMGMHGSTERCAFRKFFEHRSRDLVPRKQARCPFICFVRARIPLEWSTSWKASRQVVQPRWPVVSIKRAIRVAKNVRRCDFSKSSNEMRRRCNKSPCHVSPFPSILADTFFPWYNLNITSLQKRERRKRSRDSEITIPAIISAKCLQTSPKETRKLNLNFYNELRRALIYFLPHRNISTPLPPPHQLITSRYELHDENS